MSDAIDELGEFLAADSEGDTVPPEAARHAEEPTDEGFDLSEAVPFGVDVRPGTSVLVSGPPMFNKRQLALDLLAADLSPRDGVVAVVTDDRIDTVRRQYRDRAGSDAMTGIGVVDCRGGNGTPTEQFDSELDHRVSSPGDLTGLGIAISRTLTNLSECGATRFRLSVSSLSTLLTYVDVGTLFKFCYLVNARIEAMGGLCVYTIDTGVHETRTVNTFKRLVDGSIELREGGFGQYEARVLGFSRSKSKWVKINSH